MAVRITKKRITAAALISFTDVIFLLLIFLLISSSFITHSGIKVNLPGSGSQQNEFNKNINLTLTKNDELFVDSEKTDWKNLPRLLNERLIDDPEQVVVIRADEEIPLKKIVRLLDLAKLSGSNRFFIATEIDLKEINLNE